MLVFCLVFALDKILLQVRIQICSQLWGPRGLGVVNLDILYFSLLLLVVLVYFYFVLKHSVDEKIYKILTSKFT